MLTEAPLPYDGLSDVPSPPSAHDKIVRRRSSKACDQCRKAKCKCERSGRDGEPCKSCVLLGTECTFLGPSRKRGPAKGYLSDLELKLHQLEALVGSIIGAAAVDNRARSLIADMSQDDIARDILQRVEYSPFGPKGRRVLSSGPEADAAGDEAGSETSLNLVGVPTTRAQGSSSQGGQGARRADRKPIPVFPGATPEWQDHLIDQMTASAVISRPASSQRVHHPLKFYAGGSGRHSPSASVGASGGHARSASHPMMPSSAREGSFTLGAPQPPTTNTRLFPLQTGPDFNFGETTSALSAGGGAAGASPNGESPRQRRRIDHTPSPLSRAAGSISAGPTGVGGGVSGGAGAGAGAGGGGRAVQLPPLTASTQGGWDNSGPLDRASGFWSTGSSSSHHGSRRTSPHMQAQALEPLEGDDLADDMGQLSMNDDHQVRYHGKSSGLYILGHSERLDNRNRDGLWQFPPARVWPLAPDRIAKTEKDIEVNLPQLEHQRHLLDLYFVHVHPTLPIVPRRAFLQEYYGEAEDAGGPEGSAWAHTSSAGGSYTSQPQGQCRVPKLLLLAMFALGARYSDKETPLPPPGHMWTAGDSYFEDAKMILNQTYAQSRRSTCQALLLLCYREIGLGAMAQAWIYAGMAVRMAQDLGLHRSIDKWHVTGARQFSEAEKDLRKRIWYACVIMDKYVSTYIGRPLAIFERDYDTPLPAEGDEGEVELHALWKSIPPNAGDIVPRRLPYGHYTPTPGRIMSCFRAAAQLACHLGAIVETLYSLRHPVGLRQADAAQQLEERLDKWLFDLPEHLRFDPSAKKPVPPPSVLTLHMQYWSTVLLLHRPFIKFKQDVPRSPESPVDDKSGVRSARAFDVCTFAATQVANIATAYRDTFSMRRCPAFLTYYVFSAGITHTATLTENRDDLQASIGLRKCIEFLKEMELVWPSANRAWELLRGSKVDLHEAELARLASAGDRHKRGAEEAALNGWQGPPSSQRSTPVQLYGSTSSRPFGSYSMPSTRQTQPANSSLFGSDIGQWNGSNRSNTFPSTSVRTPLEASPAEPPAAMPQTQYLGPSQQHFVADPQDSTEGQLTYWGEYPPPDPFNDPSLLTSNYYGLPSTYSTTTANPAQSSLYSMPEYPPLYQHQPPTSYS